MLASIGLTTRRLHNVARVWSLSQRWYSKVRPSEMTRLLSGLEVPGRIGAATKEERIALLYDKLPATLQKHDSLQWFKFFSKDNNIPESFVSDHLNSEGELSNDGIRELGVLLDKEIETHGYLSFPDIGDDYYEMYEDEPGKMGIMEDGMFVRPDRW